MPNVYLNINTQNHVFLNVLKPTAINEYVPLPEFEKKGVSVYLKREDLVFPLASGNKWRKLKYNFKALKETVSNNGDAINKPTKINNFLKPLAAKS